MRRILLLLLVVAAIFLTIYGYRHYKTGREQANGDIHCVGCDTPEEHARFLRINAGESPDSRKAADPVAASGFPPATATTASAPTATPAPAAQPSSPIAQLPAQPAAPSAQPVLAAQAAPPTMPAPVATPSGMAPAGDTLAPSSPNGMAFGGKGTYQWYRQGNITWRVDTVTGHSCIVFATMEEWRKSIVLSHGCGRDA